MSTQPWHGKWQSSSCSQDQIRSAECVPKESPLAGAVWLASSQLIEAACWPASRQVPCSSRLASDARKGMPGIPDLRGYVPRVLTAVIQALEGRVNTDLNGGRIPPA
eukprot:351776-Chlamydomonas_euryale.AAC.9